MTSFQMNHKYSQTKLWFVFEQHVFDEKIYYEGLKVGSMEYINLECYLCIWKLGQIVHFWVCECTFKFYKQVYEKKERLMWYSIAYNLINMYFIGLQFFFIFYFWLPISYVFILLGYHTCDYCTLSNIYNDKLKLGKYCFFSIQFTAQTSKWILAPLIPKCMNIVVLG
jgi:hypothetical protein